MKDINNLSGALAYNYNPDRYSPPVPPVPHNSLTGLNEESDSSDSTTSSSVLSRSPPSSDSDVSPASTRPKSQHTESSCLPKHLATLARIYDFPPIPPAPPLLTPASPTSTLSSSPSSHDSYQSGIMMAARRISETLRPAKRSDKDSRADVMQRERERKPIPGWTDGSDAWRADVYSFAKPMDPSTVGKRAEEGIERAYGGFAASPHRSRGVCSTLSDAGVPDLRASTQSLDGGARKAVDELYEKYPLSHSKRSESRVSLQYNPSFTSLCSTSPSAVEDSLLGSRSLPSAGVRRREVKLVKPGAEGKLLVPDVKMVSRSPPSSYASSATTASWYPSSSRRSFGSIPSIRSPLSRVGSELMMGEVQEECESLEDSASEYGWRSESSRCKGKEERERERKEKLLVGGSSETTPTFSCGSESGSLPAPKRPTVETRTWSYDNLLTYPAMPLPVKKVKRKERKIVDGEEKEVEVEVDVCEPKRLFLFPGKEVFRG
ncbi:hypothetical protein GLOTRDRAFT_116440 [Gloeophyllum trabeum ATCC 11539]|uniref:Uncharacterized protein n=1 Tax=Gloeophyllum trabeum (strain ATCC 11539 / FP-39264 / Madison 617) TaxID=670483 RepID=S7Q4Z1_GLOTA|nr:uncharacterized protein GLOTRDRAFT_116440 [Gloeophyllum trabeum ATCC 11539]EPQ54588.1 hypothetical protein GLOTRDRAFT_116440 [Gloeophyllum trabeum ATCC 11539]